MHIRRVFFIVFLLSLSSFSLFAQDLQEKHSNLNLPADYKPEKNVFAMVYGDKHVFAVMTPEGWLIDRGVAKQMDLGSFFYPEGQRQPVVSYMYAQGYDKEAKDTLEKFIAADIDEYKKKTPGLKVAKVETIITEDSYRAEIYEFLNLPNAKGERVAYINAPSAICVLVFSSSSAAEYKTYLGSYRTFVKSYRYLSDDPEKALKLYEEQFKSK